MRKPDILQLDVSGIPVQWVTYEDAATLYSKGRVAWTPNSNGYRIWGGTRRDTGSRSFMDLSSIIAVKEENYRRNRDYLFKVPRPDKEVLFRRDKHLCAYCGSQFKEDDLTRDHIIPQVAGGQDTWMNLVTACKSCNHHKADRTPKRAGMELLYVPYIPCRAEWLILKNRRILADQMEFLLAQVPSDSKLHG